MNKTMLVSEDCIKMIKGFESLSLKGYYCPANKPTIGWGTTHYPDGRKVNVHDEISEEQAEQYLNYDVNKAALTVAGLVRDIPLSQHQFDALVDFTYNLGDRLPGSTLLKKILANPKDVTIWNYAKDEHNKPIIDSCEFLRWVRGGVVLPGLVRRRAAEADLYKQNL